VQHDHAVVGFKPSISTSNVGESVRVRRVRRPGPRTMAPRVDFVDNDDKARLLALLEESRTRLGPRRRTSQQNRARDRKNGNSLRGTARAAAFCRFRRPRQNALGNASASFWNFAGSRVVDDLLQLFLARLPGTSLKVSSSAAWEEARPALAERHRLVAAGLHLAHEETRCDQRTTKWSATATDVALRSS